MKTSFETLPQAVDTLICQVENLTKVLIKKEDVSKTLPKVLTVVTASQYIRQKGIPMSKSKLYKLVSSRSVTFPFHRADDKFADSPMLVPRKLPYPEKRRPIDVRAQLLQPSIGKAVVSPPENIYPLIRNLIANVIHKEIDITVRAEDWFIICAILARLFSEEGRAMFHNVSKFYPNYTKEECDAKFTRCLLRPYSYSAEQIFEIARKYGVY